MNLAIDYQINEYISKMNASVHCSRSHENTMELYSMRYSSRSASSPPQPLTDLHQFVKTPRYEPDFFVYEVSFSPILLFLLTSDQHT
jgi:hypothetical protein